MPEKTFLLPEKSGYRILRQLGSGGEGTVFLVCHRNTEQLRAAKVLTDVRADRRHELNMMKHLNHPGLPKVMDLIELNGDIWLIMEYIQGSRLDQEVARGISEEQIWSVARQLAQVLIYLHTRKPPIWHLDIKPSNILIRPDKSLVLIDFGASIRGHPSGDSDKRFGTRGFAAPEQMEVGGCVDARTDLFGAGAVLHYCYYRKAPDEQILNGKKSGHKHCGSHVPRMSLGLLSERRMNKVLGKCLARNPSQRYQDSQQFYKAVCNAGKKERICRQLYKTAGSLFLLIMVSAFLAVSFLNGTLTDSQIKVEAGGVERDQEKLPLDESESGKMDSENLETGNLESDTLEPEEPDYQEYQRLLEMAGGMGLSQAAECYQKAASMYPADSDWYLQLIEQVTLDSLFEEEEERLIKELIYAVQPESGRTALEQLEDNREAYGQFAYRLGLAYWYYYAGNGGKSAATWWFQMSISAQEESKEWEWEDTAVVLARIGSYYGMLGNTSRDEEREIREWEYWEDMEELWYLYREKQEKDSICYEAASEILSFLILKAYVVQQNGEPKEKVLQMLTSIHEFMDGSYVTEDIGKREKLEEQYTAALLAIERAYQGQEESE